MSQFGSKWIDALVALVAIGLVMSSLVDSAKARSIRKEDNVNLGAHDLTQQVASSQLAWRVKRDAVDDSVLHRNLQGEKNEMNETVNYDIMESSVEYEKDTVADKTKARSFHSKSASDEEALMPKQANKAMDEGKVHDRSMAVGDGKQFAQVSWSTLQYATLGVGVALVVFLVIFLMLLSLERVLANFDSDSESYTACKNDTEPV